MRWGLVILGLCASATAALGRRRPPPPDGLRDPFASRAPCDQGKSWPKLRACLERDRVRVTLLSEVEGAKLVALVTEGATSTPLVLYVQSGAQWRRASFYGINNASSELLGFKRIDEHRWRIDQGFLAQVGQRVWLRRQLTTLCTETACRTIITACDAFTDGKSSGAFHGTLYAEGASVFVVGDKSRAGPQCMPQAMIFRSEPVGEPLE